MNAEYEDGTQLGLTHSLTHELCDSAGDEFLMAATDVWFSPCANEDGVLARPALASWVVLKGPPELERDILRAKPPARAHTGAHHCGSHCHQLGVCLTPNFFFGRSARLPHALQS